MKLKGKTQEPLGPLVHEEDYIVPLLSRVLDLTEKAAIGAPETISMFRIFSCHPENKPNKRPKRIQKRINPGTDDIETPAIVLSSAESAVKLQISNVTSHDQRRRLYLGVKPYSGSVQALQYHGHVQEKIINLIVLALKLVDRLSFLFRYPSQYSQFVPKYLTLLGIGHYCYFDDCERVLLIAEGQGAAEIFLNLFEKHKNTDSVYVWKSFMLNKLIKIWMHTFYKNHME